MTCKEAKLIVDGFGFRDHWLTYRIAGQEANSYAEENDKYAFT